MILDQDLSELLSKKVLQQLDITHTATKLEPSPTQRVKLTQNGSDLNIRAEHCSTVMRKQKH